MSGEQVFWHYLKDCRSAAGRNFISKISLHCEAAAIQPGTAALFVLVRKVTADKVLEGLKGEGGTVLKTSLDHTKEAALQAALAGVQAVVPASAA